MADATHACARWGNYYENCESAEELYKKAILQIVENAKRSLGHAIEQGTFEIGIGSPEWSKSFVDDVAATLTKCIAPGERFSVFIGVVTPSTAGKWFGASGSSTAHTLIVRLVEREAAAAKE